MNELHVRLLRGRMNKWIPLTSVTGPQSLQVIMFLRNNRIVIYFDTGIDPFERIRLSYIQERKYQISQNYEISNDILFVGPNEGIQCRVIWVFCCNICDNMVAKLYIILYIFRVYPGTRNTWETAHILRVLPQSCGQTSVTNRLTREPTT